MNYSVIIVAAGKGTRTGLTYNKVFYKIGNAPIITQTLKPFLEDADCAKIIMSISPHEQEEFEKIIQSEKIVYVPGGATRQESGYLGLQEVDTEFVMIHDGVRPFLTTKHLEALKAALKTEDAALLMVPLIDTIKEVKGGYVVHTPERSNYMSAQTPQAFRTELIKKCHEEAKKHPEIVASDDAMLAELFSDTKIKVVEGSYDNIKVTTQRDLNQIHLLHEEQNT